MTLFNKILPGTTPEPEPSNILPVASISILFERLIWLIKQYVTYQ